MEIGGVKTSVSAWNFDGDGTMRGAQIDMLIMRADNIVNLCEMKFTSSPYTINKEEEQKLLYRINSLKETLTFKQKVHLTMITTFGVVNGKHSGKVQRTIIMDDLFT